MSVYDLQVRLIDGFWTRDNGTRKVRMCLTCVAHQHYMVGNICNFTAHQPTRMHFYLKLNADCY